MTTGSVLDYAAKTLWILGYLLCAVILFPLLKAVYNLSPFHPLSKYPGPSLWRASRLFASYHHACGDLYQHIAAIHDKYGATVRIAPDELSFTSPAAWSLYSDKPQLQKTRFHFAPPDPQRRIPESMITASDAEHTRLRRLFGAAFLNSSIKEVEPVLQQYVEQLCSRLNDASSEGSQNMVEWFLWTLNDVIGQLALNQEFQCLEKRRLHPWPSFLMDVLKQTALLNQFRRFGMSMKLLVPLMSKQMIDARESFFVTVENAIHQRLALESDEVNHEKNRPDIIGLMLRDLKNSERLTEREIMANSILIVAGGSETTSTCLSATVYYLCKTPRVMQKLKNEIRRSFTCSEDITLNAIGKLDYLKATINESLRIFPVASYITPRVTPKGGHVINGEVIPEDTYVSLGQWYMGRSENFFDEPMEFRPERWLEEEKGPSGLTPDEVLRPFSLGVRNCIGKPLALAEANLVTAKLLWHFDLELDGPHDTWVQDARFYILWQLKPLRIKLRPVERE